MISKICLDKKEFIIDDDLRLSYNDAILYCQLLSFDGNADWRMATKKDVKILYESKQYQKDYVAWIDDANYNAATYFINDDELYFSELNPEYVGFPVAIVRDICI